VEHSVFILDKNYSDEVARLSVLYLVEKFLVFHFCDVTKNGATRDKSYSQISKDSQLQCVPYEDSLYIELPV